MLGGRDLRSRPWRYLDAIRAYVDVGFDHISLHQVGADQEGFMSFFGSQVAPKLG